MHTTPVKEKLALRTFKNSKIVHINYNKNSSGFVADLYLCTMLDFGNFYNAKRNIWLILFTNMKDMSKMC